MSRNLLTRIRRLQAAALNAAPLLIVATDDAEAEKIRAERDRANPVDQGRPALVILTGVPR